MKNYLVLLVLLCTCSSLIGQEKNPFEVFHQSDTIIEQSTNAVSSITEEVAPAVSQIPLIINNSDSLPLETTITETIDSIETEPEAEVESISEEEVDSSISTNPNKTDRYDNPFEVDHIPLLKRELKDKQPSRVKKIKKEEPQVIKEETTQTNTKLKRHTKPFIAEGLIGNFVFWIIVFSLLLLTVVINLKRKSFSNLYKSITNDNYLSLIQREENNGTSAYFLLLYLLYFINITLFVYLLSKNWFNVSPSYFFLKVLGVILLIYLVRHTVMFLLSWIYPLKKELSQYDFTIKIFNIIFGIILIPLNIFIAYSPLQNYAIYLVVIIFVLLILIRSARGLFLSTRVSNFNLFHFFIYLCSCEIGPLAVALKLIANTLAIF